MIETAMIWRSRWYPRVVFLACLVPLLILTWRWTHNELGINRVEFVSRYLGIWTLRFVVMTLAITPLRRLPHLHGLIRIRRMLGLFAFFYAFLHGLHYFAMDVQWDWRTIRDDLTIRRFFIVGMTAFLLMVPLALTSSNAAIRWMGGRNWQRLHRLFYLTAIAGVIHYMWQGKTWSLSSVRYAAIVAFLLLVRVAYAASKRWNRPLNRPLPMRYGTSSSTNPVK